MAVNLAYCENAFVQNWVTETEQIKMRRILNKNEFIQVSFFLLKIWQIYKKDFYFIGWIVKMKGTLTPNLKFPFVVHHNK
jgi:hypothetical protein